MKDWKQARGSVRHEQGYVEPARSVPGKGAMAKGPVTRHGKTSTTLENGVSSVAPRIGNDFKPTPRGR